MSEQLLYPEKVIKSFRHQFCPMCKGQLIRKTLFDDNIPRVTCPACGWIQLLNNAVCVAVVAHSKAGIVVIEPPDEDGVGLPAGLIEYGEAPQTAATREVYEETGLEVTIVDDLGWFFIDRSEWPGPTFYFLFEAEIIGGSLKASEEGAAKLIPLENLPLIAAGREGSRRALAAYLTKLNKQTKNGI